MTRLAPRHPGKSLIVGACDAAAAGADAIDFGAEAALVSGANVQHADRVRSGCDEFAHGFGAKHDLAIARGAALMAVGRSPVIAKILAAFARIFAAFAVVAALEVHVMVVNIARSSGRRSCARVAALEAPAARVKFLHRRESYQSGARRAYPWPWAARPVSIARANLYTCLVILPIGRLMS
jgi:hypothetical protein